jgi:protein TonB
MFKRPHFFLNREWVARGAVVLMLALLVLSQQVFHLKPPPLIKPLEKPLHISLAAPEPTPVPPQPPQLVEPPPPPPPPPPPEPVPVEPPPPPPKPVVSPKPIEPPPKPVEKPKPVVKPKPVKHVHHEKKQPPKHPPKPVAKPEPVKEPTPEKPVTPAPTNPAPAKPVAPSVPASNPSREAAYVSQVRMQIEHHKIYPALARRLDMSGTVEVAYILNRQGKLVSVSIVKTSGSDILDKAALQAVRSALFPPIPADAWRGDSQKQFRTSLVYSLSDN